MSIDRSCPSILPDGIIRNTTGYEGPGSDHKTIFTSNKTIWAGAVDNRDGSPPDNKTMHHMIECCVNQVFAGEIDSRYVLTRAL